MGRIKDGKDIRAHNRINDSLQVSSSLPFLSREQMKLYGSRFFTYMARLLPAAAMRMTNLTSSRFRTIFLKQPFHLFMQDYQLLAFCALIVRIFPCSLIVHLLFERGDDEMTKGSCLEKCKISRSPDVVLTVFGM